VKPAQLLHTAVALSAALIGLSGSLSAHAADPASRDAAALACPPRQGAPTVAGWRALGAGLWWLPGASGDSDALNRGATSNLLLLIDAERTWLVGAGPSVAYGRALAADIRCRFGRDVSDAIAPWPRPELVLGLAGLPDTVRLWAHADVAAAMAERCSHCVERLASRLGEHAADLGDPRVIPSPDRLLHGTQGRLGPWHWWRIERTPGTATTVWAHVPSGVISAHGLSWSDGAPDLRDATLDGMTAGLSSLRERVTRFRDAAGIGQPHWLPEQGPVGALAEPPVQAAYWQALRVAVDAALAAGASETDPPASSLPGVPAELTRGERHALNWQRAWREREEQAFDATPAAR
jgi:hypothetical protein